MVGMRCRANRGAIIARSRFLARNRQVLSLSLALSVSGSPSKKRMHLQHAVQLKSARGRPFEGIHNHSLRGSSLSVSRKHSPSVRRLSAAHPLGSIVKLSPYPWCCSPRATFRSPCPAISNSSQSCLLTLRSSNSRGPASWQERGSPVEK